MNFKYGETLINMSFLKGSSSWFNLALLLFFQIKILYLHKIYNTELYLIFLQGLYHLTKAKMREVLTDISYLQIDML